MKKEMIGRSDVMMMMINPTDVVCLVLCCLGVVPSPQDFLFLLLAVLLLLLLTSSPSPTFKLTEKVTCLPNLPKPVKLHQIRQIYGNHSLITNQTHQSDPIISGKTHLYLHFLLLGAATAATAAYVCGKCCYF